VARSAGVSAGQVKAGTAALFQDGFGFGAGLIGGSFDSGALAHFRGP
jgi:hypothetical protein